MQRGGGEEELDSGARGRWVVGGWATRASRGLPRCSVFNPSCRLQEGLVHVNRYSGSFFFVDSHGPCTMTIGMA